MPTSLLSARHLRPVLICGCAAFLFVFVAPARAEPPREAAGRYGVWRAEDKDTGCMLTLETRAGPGGHKAQLAPACRDNGMVIFDPVGWSLDRGRLVLTARKGHKAHFERRDGGVWSRDAKEGKALMLKPL